MAEVLFLPHYAEVLESVVAAAQRRGGIEVECDLTLDRAVVADQIRWYGVATGRSLRCRSAGDRLAVTCRR